MGVFRTSLLLRIVAYFFLLSLIIVILLGAVSYLFIIRNTKRVVLERMGAYATIKEEALNRWVDDQTRKVVIVSSLPEVRKWCELLLTPGAPTSDSGESYGTFLALFKLIRSHFPEFLEIFLLSKEGGRIVLSTDQSNVGKYRVLDSYFVEGLKGTYVQNTYPSAVSLQPTMTIATPVNSSNGELLGVLAVNLNLESMDRIIQERVGLGRTGEAYLVDRYNVFVSAERFGRADFPRGVHSTGIDAAVQGNDGAGVYPNYKGILVLGVYRWIEQRELALVLEVHEEEAYASARRQTLLLAATGLGLILLLAAGVYLLSRRIVGPIIAVQDAAVQISAGNLNVHVPSSTQDEIGVLASSFNNMTGKLKQLYGELKQREEHFRSLIESSSDIIAVLDERGKLSFVSPSVERVMGYGVHDLTGADPFGLIHPEDRQRVFRDIFLEIKKGKQLAREHVTFRFRHMDKSWRVLEARGKNLLDHPAIAGIVINARDISERKELEEHLLQAQKMEAVGRLAGGIAHDFNNLLTAIIGYAEVLPLQLEGHREALDQVDEIRKAAERAASLTQQLLAYSRKQILQPKVLDINTLVEDMQDMLRRLIGENIELVVNFKRELLGVKADPGQMQQVLLNLVINSRDAMLRGGRITIETGLTVVRPTTLPDSSELVSGEYVLITVSDTGSGMEEGTLKRIFDPFFTTKDPGKGTGLGLSTVYGIVKQSGGHIVVSSQMGSGTISSIYLPLVPLDEDMQTQNVDGAEDANGSETILVVEDEEAIRKMIATILRRLGYAVYQAVNPEDAMQIAREQRKLDMVLTDMVMPGGSGRELVEHLLKYRRDLKVLYMSGYSEDGIRQQEGMSHSFISKPFTPAALAREIRGLLDT
ncbi:MAG: PAS domain S-box protein [Spirochaetaceae bacterium]|nr:MAG: PAS domain S-box protein [Spirochaetaceae bacterium]